MHGQVYVCDAFMRAADASAGARIGSTSGAAAASQISSPTPPGITPLQLAKLLHNLLPDLTMRDMRAVLMLVASADVNGDGYITCRELMMVRGSMGGRGNEHKGNTCYCSSCS